MGAILHIRALRHASRIARAMGLGGAYRVRITIIRRES